MSASNTQSQAADIEFKSGQFTLPRLLLKTSDMDLIADQVEAHVNRSHGFFANTPVVIDVGELDKTAEVNFPWLVGMLRGYDMIPFGVRGASESQKEMAEFMELAILSDNNHDSSTATAARARKPVKPAAAAQTAAGWQAAKIVSAPVRSGQRIYAPRGDLIITAQVSSGAEVIADGNIHIYGTLRGRALAGVRGNREARIFCHKLEADLIAVAGQYRVYDSIDEDLKKSPVQVSLNGKKLEIKPV